MFPLCSANGNRRCSSVTLVYHRLHLGSFSCSPSFATGGTRRRQDAKKKRRNSFHRILLGVFAPSRGPTRALLYQGHGADLLTSHADFQLLTKNILSSCETRVRPQRGQIR